ncbi:MAG: DsbA family oxidoreductase [Pseudomonadota bacterium]
MTTQLVVDLVSDPVCPWCYVGLHSWACAKAALQDDFEIITRMRPYQLNPDTPIAGIDRAAYYERKFPDAAFRHEMRVRLIDAAKEAGVVFDPSIPKVLPNTLRAHRVLRWAHFEGRHETLATRLYAAFWEKGADLGDTDVLCTLAADAGMDAEDVRKKLDGETDAALVAGEAEALRSAGVTGVPTFIINEKTGFSGALPSEKLAAAVRHAFAQN